MYNFGQPIFGSRAGNDEAFITNEDNSSNRYKVSNAMIEDAHMAHTAANNYLRLSPHFPIPPIHMDWQGYLRNFLDESAAETFANAKHGASKMIKLCSIYRSHTLPLLGGEGRDGSGDYTYGHGVRSLTMFDLTKLI